ELRRVEEDVLVEALGALGAFYRDVLASRKGAGAGDDLVSAWARSPIPDAALVAAAACCVETTGTFTYNANASLAIEATLVELARLAPPPAALEAVGSEG
ncbi:MAG: hypothetical protein M3271_11420, partial [Actinomycetota bacterium]|nr:hypothetical protein [Actinomycetota bacterium]